ncbi:hypothetical protein O0550_13505 [Brevibacillus halotolerans]|uniref:hypothetical protein n=1 Tax=Brevibacillus TaxID=55080 RepID=UPI00215C53A8|nr:MULTISPECIES: hypothetical protein [Brevibacillus]MCR8964211.1 hypothetical protein [Brevibacillus laterosporus]MCZ0836366.1 hypothetical protein [Brevibacillus halotolerans]
MAVHYNDVLVKTIEQSSLSDFQKQYFSITQIQELLQVKSRLQAETYILPKEMKLVEMFYIPEKKNQKDCHIETKQLKNRYYVPKDVWTEFLIEEEWAKRISRKIIERFSFVIGNGNKIRHILVVKENEIQLEADDMINLLSSWPKRNRIELLQRKDNSGDFKTISKPASIYNLCDQLIMKSPITNNVLTYLNIDQVKWISQTDLFKNCFVVDYHDAASQMDSTSKFNFYLELLLQDDQYNDESINSSNVRENIQLLTTTRSLEEYLFTLSSVQTKVEQALTINELLKAYNNYLSLLEFHRGDSMQNLSFSKEVINTLYDSFSPAYKLNHSLNIGIPEEYFMKFDPIVFEYICSYIKSKLSLLTSKEIKVVISN